MIGDNFFYIKDTDSYYDGNAIPSRRIIPKDTALKRLAKYNVKYQDKEIAYEYLKELRDHGILESEAKQMLNDEKKAKQIDFDGMYEELRAVLPLYSYIRPNGTRSFYLVNEQLECTPVNYVKLENLTDALMAHKATWQRVRNYWATTPQLEGQRHKFTLAVFLKHMIPNFLLMDETLVLDKEPVRFSWEPDVYAFKKFDLGMVEAGPTPTWDQFLGRLDFPEVFQAWVWGLFEPTNNIRQAMWLTGGGDDGKSSVQRALEIIFGEQHVHSCKGGDEVNNRFLNESIYGKCLVNFADTENPHLLKTSALKQLTGGDSTSIEGKGKAAFRGVLYAKLLVTSNKKPMINPESAAETSRLITLNVQPLPNGAKDEGFKRRLVEESGAFLYNCREAFLGMIAPGNNALLLPEKLQDKMFSECASEMHYVLEDFVSECLEFGPHYFCEVRKINPKLKQFTSETHFLAADKVRYFMSDFVSKMNFRNISLKRIDINGKIMTAYVGFRLKGDDACLLKLVPEKAE